LTIPAIFFAMMPPQLPRRVAFAAGSERFPFWRASRAGGW
jgi:hypothetical protein